MTLGTRLYRRLLREAKSLPDQLTSSYYRERIRSTFRAPVVAESSLQAARRTKRARQLLRNLQAANDGYLHALTRVFETAHGIRGPEKHASLAPFLDPHRETHTFSPSLSALITSPISHTARPPSSSQLSKPPTMPERADPTSEEARLLGPLVPERIKAIKKRWWNNQTGKIRAPIAVQVWRDGEQVQDLVEAKEILTKLMNGLEGVDLGKGQTRLDLLESKANVSLSSVPLPPKRLQSPQQRSQTHPQPLKLARPVLEDSLRRVFSPTSRNTKWHNPKQVTSRLLRRIAAETLAIAPMLKINVNENGKNKSSFEVVKSRFAKGEKGRFAEIEKEELEWLQGGEAEGGKGGKGGKGKG
ncbi:hypothetical protein JCM16303_005571 [Sporobolomyces ruberrimus]